MGAQGPSVSAPLVPMACQTGPLYTRPNPDLAGYSGASKLPVRAHRQRVPKAETALQHRRARFGFVDWRFRDEAEAPESEPRRRKSRKGSPQRRPDSCVWCSAWLTPQKNKSLNHAPETCRG